MNHLFTTSTFMVAMTLVGLASLVDARLKRIPKGLNHMAIILTIMIHGLSAIMWGFLIYLSYIAIYKISQSSIGYGDVRIAPIATLVLDSVNPIAIHLGAWVLAGLFLISIRWGKVGSLPFAPFLFASMLLMPHLR